MQAATSHALARQSEAGESGGRYRAALRDLDLAESEAFGVSQELADIRQRVEDHNLQGSPLYEARTAYEAAITELETIRAAIYESDTFQLLYAAADRSPRRGEEIEKVMTTCFDNNREYAAGKDKVVQAKKAYDRIRFELYEAEPDWANAVARARAASAEKNRAGTSVKASAMESGLEGSNARAAARRAAMAQAALADAQADLQRLQKQKPNTGSQKSMAGK